MTGNKRFIIKNERTVCDGFYGKCFVCSWKSDAEEVCNLLNEMSEENEQLKHQIQTYKTGNALLKKTLEDKTE